MRTVDAYRHFCFVLLSLVLMILCDVKRFFVSFNYKIKCERSLRRARQIYYDKTTNDSVFKGDFYFSTHLF